MSGLDRTSPSSKYHQPHGGLRLLSGPRLPEEVAGDGRADAGHSVARLGRQRDQAGRRHDRRGDQPRQHPRHDRAAGTADPRGHGDGLPGGRHAGARGSAGAVLASRPAAIASLNDRKRKMNASAAKPQANVVAAAAVPAKTLTSSACCTPAPPGVNGTSAATALTPSTSSTFLTEPPTLNADSRNQNAVKRRNQPPSWTSQTSRK